MKTERQKGTYRFGLPAGMTALVLVLAACATDKEGAEPLKLAEVARQPVESPLGNYLAGRYARSAQDTAAAATYYEAALADDPDNRNLLQRTFLLMLAEGRMVRAIELAERLSALTNDPIMPGLVLATNDIRGGRYDAARAKLTSKSKAGFGALLKPLLRAWLELGDGDPDAAVEALAALEEREAFATFRSYHLGLINDLANRPDASRKAFEDARKSAGGTPSWLALAYASMLARNGHKEEASALYEEHLDRSPDSPLVVQAIKDFEAGRPAHTVVATADDGVAEAFYGAAGALAQDRAGTAARIYTQLALFMRPGFDRALMLLGEIFEGDERWEKAIDIYESVSPSSPYSWEARVRIATSLNRLERIEEAVEALNAMIEARVDDTVAAVTLADMLRGHERYPESAAAYDRALARVTEPKERHWALYYARGIALERAKEWERAESDFVRALELKPDHPLVLNYLGYSWVEQGRNMTQAKEMIEKAVAQRPDDGYIVDSLGWVLYRMGDFEAAVPYLERAVELKPQDPVINDHLGDAYWRVGRRLEARFQWRHALALKPEDALVPAIRAKLDKGLAIIAAEGDGG